jgi:hypothetical protein
MERGEFERVFEKHYYSCQMGMRKPDAEILREYYWKIIWIKVKPFLLMIVFSMWKGPYEPDYMPNC